MWSERLNFIRFMKNRNFQELNDANVDVEPVPVDFVSQSVNTL